MCVSVFVRVRVMCSYLSTGYICIFCIFIFIFFEVYAFIILTSTLVLGINYFVIITRPLHFVRSQKNYASSEDMKRVSYLHKV